MKKFEYKKVPAHVCFDGTTLLVSKLNEFGDDGWEFILITNWDNKPAFVWFKRKIDETNINKEIEEIAYQVTYIEEDSDGNFIRENLAYFDFLPEALEYYKKCNEKYPCRIEKTIYYQREEPIK